MNASNLSLPVVALIAVATWIAGAGSARADQGDVYANPYMFSIQSYNVGLDLRTSDHWTAGPYAAYGWGNEDGSKSTYWGAGARADYYFNEVHTNSWYVSPFASRYEFTTKFSDDIESDDGKKFVDSEVNFGATNLGFTTGYAFVSDREDGPNFMIRVGIGAMNTTFDGQVAAEREDGTKEKSSFGKFSGWLPTGDVHVGLLF